MCVRTLGSTERACDFSGTGIGGGPHRILRRHGASLPLWVGWGELEIWPIFAIIGKCSFCSSFMSFIYLQIHSAELFCSNKPCNIALSCAIAPPPGTIL